MARKQKPEPNKIEQTLEAETKTPIAEPEEVLTPPEEVSSPDRQTMEPEAEAAVSSPGLQGNERASEAESAPLATKAERLAVDFRPSLLSPPISLRWPPATPARPAAACPM